MIIEPHECPNAANHRLGVCQACGFESAPQVMSFDEVKPEPRAVGDFPRVCGAECLGYLCVLERGHSADHRTQWEVLTELHQLRARVSPERVEELRAAIAELTHAAINFGAQSSDFVPLPTKDRFETARAEVDRLLAQLAGES